MNSTTTSTVQTYENEYINISFYGDEIECKVLAVCIIGFALLYSIIFNEENNFIAKIIPVLTSLYLFVRLGIKPLLSYSINDIVVSVLHAVFYGILFVCFTISIISRLTSNKIDYEKYTIPACLIESAILIHLACFKGADSFIMLMPICSLQLFVHMWTLYYEEQKAYAWRSNSIVHILENRQYTGCTVNGKSTTVSYKVHKKIEKSQEDYQIISNTQDAIISENTWLRAQELRRNKRRNTATGRRSLFSGLVYCADCGSKLHFCASKSLKKNQEFWRCSSYKDGRGTCTIHFIRDVVLEAIVKEAISELADFVRCYNSVFLYLISENKGAESVNRERSLRVKTESAKQRISDLDKLFSRIYEDNILGKLSDERYSRMANEYEAEQKRLISEVEENEKALIELQKQTVDMKMLYQGLMEFTEMKQLTPTVVNKLIERIEIHNNEKKHSHNNVKVDIYFTAVGLFDVPTEQQLINTMERVKQKKAEKSA